MPLQVACPGCHAQYSVPEQARNKQLKCQKCSRTFVAEDARISPKLAMPPVQSASQPPTGAGAVYGGPLALRQSWKFVLAAGILGVLLLGCTLGGAVLYFAGSSSPAPLAAAATKPTTGPGQTSARSSPVPTSPSGNTEFARVVSPAAAPASDAPMEKPLLVLDAGGHTEVVKRAFLTANNTQLITVSMDKTVRVWDVSSGETLRIIRPPIGRGVRGALRAAALSPDGKWLAIAGQRADPSLGRGPIYVVNVDAGRIDRVLMPKLDVFALTFSRDGRRLGAGAEEKVVIYDTATWQPVQTFEGHKALVNGVAFSPDGKYVASSAGDGTGAVWSLESGKRERLLVSQPERVTCIAWSPDGKSLATGNADGGIRLFPPPGGNFLGDVPPLQTFPFYRVDPAEVSSLSFTPDSRSLLATGIRRSGKGAVALLDAATGTLQIEFPLHTNTVMSGSVSADGHLAVTCGGNDHETFVWRRADGSIVQKFEGKGQSVWGVGWSADGKSIAWGNTNKGATEAAVPLERSFNLTELDFGDPPDGSFRRNVLADDTYQLERGSNVSQLVIKVKGQITHRYEVEGGQRIYSYSLLRGDRAVVGTNAMMYLVDLRTGKEARYYAGHTSHVMAVAPSPDGRFFLSGSTDQTVRIWDPNEQEPLLSIFVGGPDWIAWTQQGYYAASAGGERLMGWQVNNGLEAQATYHSAAQFRRSLYQPAVIQQILAAGSVTKALAAAGIKGDAVSMHNLLPPAVTILSPRAAANAQVGQRFEVKASARSVGKHPVTSLRLLVNGRPYRGAAGIRPVDQPQLGEVQASWTVDVPPGSHVLAVQAETTVSRSLSEPTQVTASGASPADITPALYVLAVGINEYPGDLRLNYAARDATVLSQSLQEKSAKVFRTVEVKQIKDREATRKGIQEGLGWLRSRMSPKDVGILFFSGHGHRHTDGTFHLLPVDYSDRDPLGSCVAGDQLKSALADMPGRVVMILDACHSGAAADRPRRRDRSLADDLVRELVTDDYGIVVFNSSQGREFSLESRSVEHGYFTLALVEGLAGKADFNRDGLVHLKELETYTGRRVRELSGGEQTPGLAKPGSIRSFPLATTAGR